MLQRKQANTFEKHRNLVSLRDGQLSVAHGRILKYGIEILLIVGAFKNRAVGRSYIVD